MTPLYAGYTHNPDLNKHVGDFVSSRIWGRPDVLRNYCSMAVLHDGALVAGTVFHNWHPESGVIELTSASINRRWLTRDVIRCLFRMAFDEIGAQLAVMRVSEHNAVMIAIARRFGFSEVLVQRARGRNEAEWIFSLGDDEWQSSRWV